MGAMASPLTGADGNVEFLAATPAPACTAAPDVDRRLLDAALAEVEAG